MFGISYWILPLFAGCVWLATLLGMLGTWLAQGSPMLASMTTGQHIAYISDIGATNLKPLFIAGSTVMVVVFDFVFISERWLRHKGRLAHNTTKSEKILSIFAVIFSIIGAAGLILLTIFDTLHYHNVHDSMLGVFIGGYVITAIFICAEYQRLGVHLRNYKILRISFWIKLAFIIIEVGLAVGFGVENYRERYNTAAVLEWIVSLFYILFVLSFVVDFLPAVHSKHHRFPSMGEIEAGQREGLPSMTEGPTSTRQPGYGNNPPMAEQERYYSNTAAPQGAVPPSRNF